MGKNLLTSIALAGSLLAAEPIKSQEGADNAAGRTNKALIELINELPAGFEKAREVVKWDIILTDDGDLSDSDKLAIENHMWKFTTTVVAEKAQKVREAMNGVETVIAEEENAALNESPEEKKERLEREKKDQLKNKIIKVTNEAILDKKKWSSVQAWQAKNDAEVEIEETKWTLVFSIERSGTRGQAFLSQKLFTWKYQIELDSSGWEIGIFWQSGNDYKKFYLQQWNNTLILDTDAKVDICIFPDVANPEIIVRKIHIIAEGDIVVAEK